MIHIFVRKSDKESSDRLIQRFTKRAQQSRLVQYVRNRRYFAKAKSRRQVRQAALMRDYYRKLRQKMKFFG